MPPPQTLWAAQGEEARGLVNKRDTRCKCDKAVINYCVDKAFGGNFIYLFLLWMERDNDALYKGYWMPVSDRYRKTPDSE